MRGRWAFTAALSFVFALPDFRCRSMVALRGGGGMIGDAVPPSMVGGFMSALIPILPICRRLRRGSFTGAAFRRAWPRNATTLGLSIAAAATAIGLARHSVLLLGPPVCPFATVLAWKASYGVMLGFLVAYLAATLAQGDVPDRDGR